MPGAGKSSIGRMISKKLRMSFVDGDKLIEQKTGKKLYEIINECGLDEFKKIEESVLYSINEDNLIIAPGGRAVYYDNVMRKFKQNGIIVYLYASVKTIEARLGDFSKRGVVLENGKTIRDLYNERSALYRKYADITINCDGDLFAKYKAILLHELKKYNKELMTV